MINSKIKKSKNRIKGITLISLIITILVMLIIATVTVIGITNLVDTGKKTAFATDLKNVEEAVALYYNDNGSFPTTTVYTLNGLKTLSAAAATKLEQEIAENDDTSGTFSEVNMSELNITGGTRGKKADGDGSDIFVISSENMRVYYPKGRKIGGETYFSLTANLTKGTNFENEKIDTSSVTTVETEGIKLTKSKKDWTNDLSITVETIIGVGETASYLIAGATPESPTTIVSGAVTEIQLNSTTITGTALNTFNAAEAANKTIVVKKIKNGAIVATATMNISNLDLLVGVISAPTIKSYNNNNILDFTSALAGQTDIKEIRYEYITKYNEGGIVTMTIANPCVVTLANHGFATNRPIIFTTTGALPNAITAGTTYYVKLIGANTFNLSTVLNGASLSTLGGTQSGVHTYFQEENYYTSQPTINLAYMLNTAKKQTGTYSIVIPKNVKTLAVSIVDNSGNITEHNTITIPNTYLKANVKAYKQSVTLSKEILKSTTDVVSKDAGTIEAWVEVNEKLRIEAFEKYIFSTYTDEKYTNTIALRHTRDDKWQAIMSSDYNNVSNLSVADTLSYGMHLFTIKWNSTEFTMFIDGVEVATTTTPKLMAATPTYFHIGTGPRLNLVTNGYSTTGDNSSFTTLLYWNADSYSPTGAFKRTGPLNYLASQYIEIHPTSVYNLNGCFKSVGTSGLASRLYYGFQSNDDIYNVIGPNQTIHDVNTETVLTQDLKAGDTIVYVNSSLNWKHTADSATYKHLGIVISSSQYLDYGYARYCYAFTDSNQVNNTVTLTVAYTGATIKAGTKVANYSSTGGSYSYSAANAALVPTTGWQKYTGNIQYSYVYNTFSYNNFRYGTKYIKIILLLNYSQDATYATLLDDIEFIDKTITLLDTKIEEICISNTARTDSEIYNRYKKVVLEKDSNVKYMLTEND